MTGPEPAVVKIWGRGWKISIKAWSLRAAYNGQRGSVKWHTTWSLWTGAWWRDVGIADAVNIAGDAWVDGFLDKARDSDIPMEEVLPLSPGKVTT